MLGLGRLFTRFERQVHTDNAHVILKLGNDQDDVAQKDDAYRTKKQFPLARSVVQI
jgi:hypothetical protein